MDRKALGRKINTARKSRGLTSERLSELCNINATYLRQIESGVKTPSLPVFVSLCHELSVSPSYLLADSLPECQPFELDILFDLWQTATPSQLSLIIAMIQSAIATIQSQNKYLSE